MANCVKEGEGEGLWRDRIAMTEVEQQDLDQPSSSRLDGDPIVLVARRSAWGLPTACPSCLPSFLYLKLADVQFAVSYNDRQPDSDDLPSIEYGEFVGFSSETGGIVEFLKNQSIADLDTGFSEAEVAQLRSLSAIVKFCLRDALLCELWNDDNSKVVNWIYFSALPWPVNKFLNWRQQTIVHERLGLKATNKDDKAAELCKKAIEAYESLSIVLGDQKFFMKTRPSSLDALFLSHALFVLRAPLENSQLKEELLKHTNLVKYIESLQKEFLDGAGSTPIAQTMYSNSRRTTGSPRQASSASSRSRRDKEPKERSEKEKMFKRRAKYFIAAQIAAIIAYVAVVGIVFEESIIDDDADHED